MYNSPIEKICSELQTQIVQEDEKMVMKAIRKVGVNVDKGELIKALQYDRNQYEKGYEDGKNEVLDKIRAEIEQEYNRLSATRADETLELGECLGLKMSLKIIDKYKTESEE